MATMATMTPTPIYHNNEKIVQHSSGIDPQRMEEQGQRLIRSYMPEQHREFFCNQQFLLLGVTDRKGRPVARAVVGPRGFVTSPDPTKLILQPLQRLDPDLFRAGSPIGLLGIELDTRRRNRLNGVIDRCDEDGLVISVRQSFGQCPKYIQVWDLQVSTAAVPAGACDEMSGGTELGEAQRRFVEQADTFFVASSYAGSAEDAAHPGAAYIGCDVSNRGGPPGFVQLLGPSALKWPDYIGNFFFMTLGNILANGRVGLLFIDFCSGDTLHISGTASVDLEDRSLPGAQRSVSVSVLSWTHTIGALPLRAAGPPQPSPYNPVPAGDDGVQTERLFVRCRAVIDEAAGIKTFVFAAPEPAGLGKGRPVAYKPGQYASFDFLGLEGEGRVTNRTWTISSHPDESATSGTLSITVKRAGIASSWLHARTASAICLEWRGADGDFTLRDGAGPALLIAGGIGITPMRTMLKELAKRGNAVTLLYSVRASSEAAFLQELARAAGASGGRIQFHVTVTGRDDAWAGHRGRIDAAFIQQRVPDFAACTAYMCGPDIFMEAVEGALEQLHFPLTNLHRESFAF